MKIRQCVQKIVARGGREQTRTKGRNGDKEGAMKVRFYRLQLKF
jgi:hypothetical protein